MRTGSYQGDCVTQITLRHVRGGKICQVYNRELILFRDKEEQSPKNLSVKIKQAPKFLLRKSLNVLTLALRQHVSITTLQYSSDYYQHAQIQAFKPAAISSGASRC